MELTWLGKQGCSITSDGITCVVDPAKKLPLPSKLSFSVLTESDTSMYDPKALEAGYVVDWPGEYEVQDHLVEGIEIPDVADGAVHTMVSITTKDQITLAFPGTLPRVPEAKLMEKLGMVHVLVLPLSSALKAEQIISIVDVISPAVVIPLYDASQEATLAAFLKHYAQGDKEPQTSFKMSRPDTIPETPDIILLSPKS